MGQSKGGGYQQLPTVTGGQQSALEWLMNQGQGNQQAAAEGYKQFLPGGGGGKPIIDAAQQRFQQETIPQIMNAFGSGAKTSSALNQALAAGGANLNSDIAAQLAQMQLQAAQGLGNMGGQQSVVGQSPQFAYQQRQQPFWQSALLAAIGAGGEAAGAAYGAGK